MTLAEEFRSRNFSKLLLRTEPLADSCGQLLTRPQQVYTDNGMRGHFIESCKLRAKANTPITRTGVLCIILCFALGIANIFHLDIIILWSVILLYVSFPVSSRSAPFPSRSR
jgi:hypothetical protein